MNPFKYWSITLGLFIVAITTTLIVALVKILATLSHGFFIDSGAVYFNSLGKRIMVRSMRIFDYAEGKKQPGAEDRKSIGQDQFNKMMDGLIVAIDDAIEAAEQIKTPVPGTDIKYNVLLEDTIGREIFAARVSAHCDKCAAKSAAEIAKTLGVKFNMHETYARVTEVK